MEKTSSIENLNKDILSFDEFKNNCNRIEAALSTDFSDPREELAKLISWIKFTYDQLFNYGNSSPVIKDYLNHLNNDVLFRTVRLLLRRKYYGSEPLHIFAVKDYFIYIAELIAKYLYLNVEVFGAILTELLDPNMNFYIKYGFPKAKAPLATAAKTSPADLWKDQISLDSCCDGLSPSGQWEVVFVEQISPVKTEIYVSWSDGTKEWMSLDDNPRIASFGSRTTNIPALMTADPNPLMTTTPTSSNVVSLVSPSGIMIDIDTQPSNAEIEEEEKKKKVWLDRLHVGSLVDARDTKGNWYQACIMEFKEEIEVVTVDDTTAHSAALPQCYYPIAEATVINSSNNNQNINSSLTLPDFEMLPPTTSTSTSSQQHQAVESYQPFTPNALSSDNIPYVSLSKLLGIPSIAHAQNNKNNNNMIKDLTSRSQSQSLPLASLNNNDNNNYNSESKEFEETERREINTINLSETSLQYGTLTTEDLLSLENLADDKNTRKTHNTLNNTNTIDNDNDNDNEDNLSVMSTTPVIGDDDNQEEVEDIDTMEMLNLPYDCNDTSSSSVMNYHPSFIPTANAVVMSNNMNAPPQETTTASTTTTSSAPPSSPTLRRVSYARIAFLGWSELYDEWIEVSSAKLAVLDSRSGGLRGDNPLRPEILQMADDEGDLTEEEREGDAGRVMDWTEDKLGPLYSPYLRSLLQTFASCNGVDIICKLAETRIQESIAGSGSSGTSTSTSTFSAIHALRLLAAIGNATKIFSVAVVQLRGGEWAKRIATLLLDLNRQELREIQMNVVEASLSAFEKIVCVCYGSHSSGISPAPAPVPSESFYKQIELLHLKVTAICLNCPFLNKRHGGLKLLSDVIKRVQNSILHPNGIKRTNYTITNFVSNNNGGGSASESISYQIVPIFKHLTSESLAKWIVDGEVVKRLFLGGDAHSSLMAKATDIIRFLSTIGMFTEDMISVVWEAGYENKETAALEVLIEIVPIMTVTHIKTMLHSIQSIPHGDNSTTGTTEIGIPVVSILSAMATKTRDILINLLNLPNSSSTVVGSIDSMDALHGQGTDNEMLECMAVHRCLLKALWDLASDGSSVNDVVASKALAQLETCVSELGFDGNEAIKTNNNKLWLMHWDRFGGILDLLMDSLHTSLSTTTNLQQSLNVLQIFLFSWSSVTRNITTETESLQSSSDVTEPIPAATSSTSTSAASPLSVNSATSPEGDCFASTTSLLPSGTSTTAPATSTTTATSAWLPFLSPTRRAVTEYIEEKYSFLALLTKCLLTLKGKFIEINSELLRETNGNAFVEVNKRGNEEIVLSNEMQKVMLEMSINKSRLCYGELLRRCLAFFHFYVRCSHSIFIPKECVEDLWTSIVRSPLCLDDEGDAVYSFISRMVQFIRLPPNATVSAVTARSAVVEDHPETEDFSRDGAASAMSVSGSGSSASSMLRRASLRPSVCSLEVITWVFQKLLCDRDFIRSHQFSTSAFVCLEKLFRWINGQLGLLVELTVPKGRQFGFQLTQPAIHMIGLTVFSEVIRSCASDDVALQAIQFLTALPDRLSTSLKAQGEVTKLRQQLLTECMQGLASVDESELLHSSYEKPVRRLLQFLSAILEESVSEGRGKFRPHGERHIGKNVQFKLTLTSRRLSSAKYEFSLSCYSTCEELCKEVAAMVDRKITDLKIFHRAKLLLADKNKTLKQLGMSGGDDMEVLMVVEKSPAQNTETLVPIHNITPTVLTRQQCLPVEPGFTESPQQFSPSDQPTAESTTDSESELLPAVILSHNPQHFGLLMKLCESSSNDVCEVVWSLINKLPTSPVILKQWLAIVDDNHLKVDGKEGQKEETEMDISGHDGVSSISSLLLEDLREDGSGSLSSFLYRLQVIEYLASTATTTTTTTSLKSTAPAQNTDVLDAIPEATTVSMDVVLESEPVVHNEGHDSSSSDLKEEHDDTNPWVTAFFARDGFSTICDAFDWLQRRLDTFLTNYGTTSSVSASASLMHATPPILLLRAIDLLVKIVQAVVLRPLLVDPFDSLVGMIKKLDFLNNFQIMIRNSTKDDRKTLHLNDFPLTYDINVITDQTNKLKDNIVKIVSRSWSGGGLVLLTHPETTGNIVQGFEKLQGNARRLQSLCLRMMSHLRRFCKLPIWSEANTSTTATAATAATSAGAAASNAKNLVVDQIGSYEQCYSYFLNIFENMMVIWGSLIVTSDDILSHIVRPALPRDADADVDTTTTTPAALPLSLSLTTYGHPPFESMMLEENINCHVLLKQMLLDHVSQIEVRGDEVADLTDFASASFPPVESISTRIGSWFIFSLVFLLQQGRRFFSTQQSMEALYTCVLLSLLDLRPSLLHPSKLMKLHSEGNIPIEVSTKPLFTLTSELLSQSSVHENASVVGTVVTTSSVIPMETKKSISIAIMNEIKAYIQDSFEADHQVVTLDPRLLLWKSISPKAWAANSRLSPSEQTLLGGLLQLLLALCSGNEVILEVLESLGTVDVLMHDCLGYGFTAVVGAYSEARTAGQPPPQLGGTRSGRVTDITKSHSEVNSDALCTDDYSRNQAYAILLEFSRWNSNCAPMILATLTHFHQSIEIPPVFEYRPEKDTRSALGYMGIKNMGCTCYMNSLLQVLYMIPEIRYGILTATTPLSLSRPSPPTSESESVIANDIMIQLQKMFSYLTFGKAKSYSPESWIFSFKDDSGRFPVNVMQQQDAFEFLQKLFERLENYSSAIPLAATTTSQTATATAAPDDGVGVLESKQEEATADTNDEGEKPDEVPMVVVEEDKDKEDKEGGTNMRFLENQRSINHLLQDTIGGYICNQMIRENPTTTTTTTTSMSSSDIREINEKFVCISLDVKGMGNLEKSLQKFVEGEQISQFEWEEGQPRVNITKRQCLSEVSDTIIFHLKRFELNFDTFQREKVNDEYVFPNRVNLFPYCKLGLMKSLDLTLPTSLEIIEQYQYELCGVVVHTGTTDSGHYYSYILESAFDASSGGGEGGGGGGGSRMDRLSEDRRWIEFNDSEVRPFDESKLATECFGGITKIHNYSQTAQMLTSTGIPNSKNAYMLVYRRIKSVTSAWSLAPPRNNVTAIATPSSSSSTTSTSTSEQTPTLAATESNDVVTLAKDTSSDSYNVQQVLLLPQKEMVLQDNLKRWKSILAFNINHSKFVITLFQSLHNHSQWTGDLVHASLLKDIWEFASTILARSYNISGYDDLCALIREQLLLWKIIESNSNTVTASAYSYNKDLSSSYTMISPVMSQDVSQNIDYEDCDEETRTAILLSLGIMDNSPTTAIPTTATATAATISTTTASNINVEVTEAVPLSANEENEEIKSEYETEIQQLNQPQQQQIQSSMIEEGPNSRILRSILLNFRSILSLLFAGDKRIRMSTADVIFFVYTVVSDAEKVASQHLAATTSATVTTATAVATTAGVNRAAGVSREELAAALDSQRDALEKYGCQLPPLATTSTPSTSTHNSSFFMAPAKNDPDATTLSYGHHVPTIANSPRHSESLIERLLFELVSDSLFQQMAENWKRVDGITHLIRNLCQNHKGARLFFVTHNMILQIVDLILADNSPCSGVMYPKGSKKRCPSSYVTLIPEKFQNEDSVSIRSIPDWTYLFEALSLLARTCRTEAMLNHSPSNTLLNVEMESPMLDSNNTKCILARSLYSTALKQPRYTMYISLIIMHQCFECYQFSNEIAEILYEALSLATTETTANIFEGVFEFLKINDSLKQHRALQLFAGQNGLLDLVSRQQTTKPRFVCVCIRSILTIALNVPVVKNTLSNPISKIELWACWMLKFTYQFTEICRQESIRAGAVVAPISLGVDAQQCLVKTGPYIVVYGESMDEREISWEERSLRTFQYLQNVVSSMGAVPDTLIPADAFEEIPFVSAQSGGSVSGMNIPSNNMDDSFSHMVADDAMSDEDYARFLQSQEEYGV